MKRYYYCYYYIVYFRRFDKITSELHSDLSVDKEVLKQAMLYFFINVINLVDMQMETLTLRFQMYSMKYHGYTQD